MIPIKDWKSECERNRTHGTPDLLYVSASGLVVLNTVGVIVLFYGVL